MELSWVLEASSSQQDFEETKYFVNTIQAKIGLANNNNKAAVTTYGHSGRRNIKCADHKTVNSFKNAVQNLQRFPDEYKNTRDGLENGLHSLLNDGCGKSNAQKIIILISHGQHKGIGGEVGLTETSKAIQEAGIILLVVTVDQPTFSENQLKQMVPSTNIYRTYKFNDEYFVDYFTKTICRNVSPTKNNTKVE